MDNGNNLYIENTKLFYTIDDIKAEYLRAHDMFGHAASVHEAYAILLEEVDELWDHVKMKQKERNIDEMRKEAVQVAAMAIKFIMSCC